MPQESYFETQSAENASDTKNDRERDATGKTHQEQKQHRPL